MPPEYPPYLRQKKKPGIIVPGFLRLQPALRRPKRRAIPAFKARGALPDQKVKVWGASVKEAITAVPSVRANTAVLPSPGWYMAFSEG